MVRMVWCELCLNYYVLCLKERMRDKVI
uniref:Uncharacterized protein n=1 Tax=Rhizophora mucronata TaxID=61149 RepID=A0A2P2QJI6_RHIMU